MHLSRPCPIDSSWVIRSTENTVCYWKLLLVVYMSIFIFQDTKLSFNLRIITEMSVWYRFPLMLQWSLWAVLGLQSAQRPLSCSYCRGVQCLITKDKLYTTDVSEWEQNSCSGITSNANVLSYGDGGETFLKVGNCNTALFRALTYCLDFSFGRSRQNTQWIWSRPLI
jgi:hypothetical protein